MPERIQLRRTKGWRKPEGAISVARPGRWGNPFAVGEECTITMNGYAETFTVTDRAQAVTLFESWQLPGLYREATNELRGHDLACWCPIGEPCHGDTLLAIANRVVTDA